MTPDDDALQRALADAEPYPVLKVKLGGPRDADTIAGVRASAPDKILRVDANAAWTPKHALRMIDVLLDYDVEFVEQPVAAHDIDGLRFVRDRSPLPIINAIPELEAELVRRRLRRVGLLGTRVVMNSRLYGGISSVDVVVPQGNSLDVTHNDYVAMATAGQATDQQRETFFSIGRDLCTKQGAEAVILAGTDLFLAFEGHECGFPTIDSARVHIDALCRESMKHPPAEAA